MSCFQQFHPIRSLISSDYRCNGRRYALLFCVSLLGTLLGGTYFFRDAIVTPISSIIITIGLDDARSLFIVALLLTTASAIVGGLVGQCKSGAIIGAVIIFWFHYLANFIQSEQLPHVDGGGHLKLLNSQALADTALIMTGLAFFVAFIGTAVGIALAEVILDPIYEMLHSASRYLAQRRPIWREKTRPQVIAHVKESEHAWWEKPIRVIGQWSGIATVITSLLLTMNSGDLFQFWDTSLHPSPASVHGTLVTGTLVSSALHGQRKNFLIYLPPSYAMATTKRYPVLYLLHGSPGTDIDWKVGGNANGSADTLISYKDIPDLIMVFPDGNGRPKMTSEWANSFDQRQLIETFVVRDLVQYIDQHYRTLPDATHRAIGGLSMGGFGAMNIAEHHPDVFGSVIALGGYYKAEGAIWGKNTAYIRANSPLLTFPKNKAAWKLHIYLGAATKDQPYYNDTKTFMKMVNTLHIPYRFDLVPGRHRWAVWEVQLYHALQWLKW